MALFHRTRSFPFGLSILPSGVALIEKSHDIGFEKESLRAAEWTEIGADSKRH